MGLKPHDSENHMEYHNSGSLSLIQQSTTLYILQSVRGSAAIITIWSSEKVWGFTQSHLPMFPLESSKGKSQHLYLCLCSHSSFIFCVVSVCCKSSHSVSQGWRCPCLPTHLSVFDIFLLPFCLPLFVLSCVNKILFLRIQSSCFFQAILGIWLRRQCWGIIKILKQKDNSLGDYYMNYANM